MSIQKPKGGQTFVVLLYISMTEFFAKLIVIIRTRFPITYFKNFFIYLNRNIFVFIQR